MPLTAGEKLGPYEILEPIGAGGMGAVYKARDTRLGREVAIKVSAERFSERFEREAQAVAALNHPNICALYDVGPNYLVMELIEGPTLAERIREGPIPLAEALPIARQMAEALEAAHEKMIVHRDLKPGNIKIRHNGTVKVLDFGLAKIGGTPAVPTDESPTISMAATQAGVILGTASYMAPEQARGKPIDKRADIWAFGVVLYEMLTGERMFRGEDVTEVLASVVKEQPDLSAAPIQVHRLLESCLQKDPAKRLRDISGVHLLLETNVAARPAAGSKLAWATAGTLALIAALAVGLLWRASQPVEHALMRLSVDLGPDAVAGSFTTAAITPDGTRLAFSARGPGGLVQLATQLLDQPKATLLAGTEGAVDPFFSPDGQWIGFFANGKMKKISVRGGAVVPLCDAPSPRGASWGKDGYIIVTLASTTGVGLSRVSESGGPPQVLTKPGEKGESTHRWPQILPGRREVLFTGNVITGTYEEASLEILSLDTGQWKVVHRGGYFGRLLPSGHLAYIRQSTLFVVPFDLESMQARGTPIPLLEDVASNPGTGGGQFDFSSEGTLVYLAGQARNPTPVNWLDSSGKMQPLLATPGLYSAIRFSPDGGRLAMTAGAVNTADIQVYDWQRDKLTRLTVAAQANFYPVWAPDGKHIIFTSRSATGYSIQWIRADGAGQAQVLLESKSEIRTYSFSPDGKSLAFAQDGAETGLDLWTLPLDISNPERPKPGKPESFLHTKSFEVEPAWSPDGRWIAYNSDSEIYVRPSSGPDVRWQVSMGGGKFPVWSPSGHELFYESLDNRIMVSPYSVTGNTFSANAPHPWSKTEISPVAGLSWNLALALDGKRFAVFPRLEGAGQQKSSVHVTFLLNFFDEVRRRVPVAN